jgi:hypothetical protein
MPPDILREVNESLASTTTSLNAFYRLMIIGGQYLLSMLKELMQAWQAPPTF